MDVAEFPRLPVGHKNTCGIPTCPGRKLNRSQCFLFIYPPILSGDVPVSRKQVDEDESLAHLRRVVRKWTDEEDKLMMQLVRTKHNGGYYVTTAKSILFSPRTCSL